MFAESSNARLSFIEEVTWGVTPATPEWQRLRFRSVTLAATLDFTQSEEITPSAAVTDVIPTGAGAGGDVPYELSYGSEVITLIEHAIRGDMDTFGIIKGGDAKKSMSLNKELVIEDPSSAFFVYQGSRVNSWTVDLTVDGNTPIGGTFNFLSKGETHDVADVAGSTYVAANGNPVMSMPNLRGVAMTDIAGAVCFSDLSFTVENALRAQNGKCTDTTEFPDLDSKGIGYGQRSITGNMNAYLANLNIYDKYKSFGEFSLSFIMTDGVRGYKVTFPRVKITEGAAPAEGNDSDVIQPFTYQALYDSVNATDIIVEVIGSVAASAGILFTDTGGSSTPADLPGTFYADGTQEGGVDVYYSVSGDYAAWYDGADIVVTATDQVGEAVPTATYFTRIASADPLGVYTPGADGTGEITGALYDPLA